MRILLQILKSSIYFILWPISIISRNKSFFLT
nr:MAG TPA: hypothetical protein [Caudoviricetes sp.]